MRAGVKMNRLHDVFDAQRLLRDFINVLRPGVGPAQDNRAAAAVPDRLRDGFAIGVKIPAAAVIPFRIRRFVADFKNHVGIVLNRTPSSRQSKK